MTEADAERRRAVLGLMGLAQRAGKLQLGQGPVLRALREARPGVVLLARDAGDDLAGKIERERGSSTVDSTLLSADDLATAFGRRKLSVVSVHDPGFVSGLVRHLSEPR